MLVDLVVHAPFDESFDILPGFLFEFDLFLDLDLAFDLLLFDSLFGVALLHDFHDSDIFLYAGLSILNFEDDVFLDVVEALDGFVFGVFGSWMVMMSLTVNGSSGLEHSYLS
jgi:hypothetical protein